MIGCGIRTTTFAAESIEVAVGRIMGDAFSDNPKTWPLLGHHEGRRSSATVYEIAESRELPLTLWRERRDAAQKSEADEAEKAELRRLLAKHGAP